MLVELNPEQLAAAQHGDGPLLIVAGAGTGKTATLVHRVACLIERGAVARRSGRRCSWSRSSVSSSPTSPSCSQARPEGDGAD